MKKKMSREEKAEFKNGKYMGGPAEERAEKKKKGYKKMALGGLPQNAPVSRGMGPAVSAMAQAPDRMGGIGAQVSQMAQARNAMRKMPMKTMKSGGMVMRGAGCAQRGVKHSKKMG